MSDTSQGPGWWQASDGKWYPPEQAPAAAPVAPPPGYGPPPQPGAVPMGGAPGYGPPPQPLGPPPMAYAPPASSGMSGCLKAFLIVLGISVVLGVIAVIAAVALVDDAVDDLAEGSAEERNDVTDVDCDTDAAGNLRATVSVTNDSSERSNYVIEVAFSKGNDQLDTSIVFINAVNPGQNAEGEASTATRDSGDVECEVTEVQRFSDESGG